MYSTKNDLAETTRAAIVTICNNRLADAIDLQTQCKQAHWNVKGQNFIALHELFDSVNEGVEDFVDLIAERAAQLGGAVEGTARTVAKRSSLTEYPQVRTAHGHVDALSSALAAFGKSARGAIDQANQAGDAVTADIFTDISRATDKWLWFVEAHLDDQTKGASR
jgi:starvation-inducible DNA-binding protein